MYAALLTWLVPAIAAGTLAALLFLGERSGDARARWLFKPATSVLFVVFALLQGPHDAYDAWIVAGLALSAVGDVALIPADRRWFLAGLVAFLLGHVAYLLAFATRIPPWTLHPAAAAAILATSAGAWLYLRPFVGAMRWPVLAYMAVITAMATGAWAVSTGGGDARVALAATLFYVSDLTVARSRFVPGSGFADRLVGLPMYYAAQFLFASTVGA
jgi:uncharacterized membrane protein YhhN